MGQPPMPPCDVGQCVMPRRGEGKGMVVERLVWSARKRVESSKKGEKEKKKKEKKKEYMGAHCDSAYGMT